MTKQNYTLKGTAFWSYTNKKSPRSNKFQVDVGRLSKKMVEFLQSEGVQVKKDKKRKTDDPNYEGYFVTAKSDYAPKVVDAKLKSIPETVVIGNGSKVVVQVHTYPWPPKWGKGFSVGLDAVQVIDLIEYEGTGDGTPTLLSVEEGFEYSGDVNSEADSDEPFTGDAGEDDESNDEPFDEAEVEIDD